MRIDSAGLPFIGGAFALGVAAGLAVSWMLAVPFLLLSVLFSLFFRDPERIAPPDQDVVLSPADGRVLMAGPAMAGAAPPGEWKQVSIFLSPMDVHVNRIPASGRITNVLYTPGRFLPAYRLD